MLKYYIIQLSGSCDAGQFLDMETGCTDCPEGHWSENDNDVACTPCPEGKTVGSGLGKGESDCAGTSSEFILMGCIFIPLVLCNTITNETNVSKFLSCTSPCRLLPKPFSSANPMLNCRRF